MDKAISIVSDERLLLNNPSFFNDPFDFNNKRDKQDKKRAANLMRSFETLTLMINALSLPHIKEALEKTGQFKVLKFEYETLIKALKKHPRFDGNVGFKTLYKIFGMKKTEFLKESEKHLLRFEKKTDGIINKIKNEALVTCFSKRFDSVLMWSHYAKSHTGVCLEYDRPFSNDFIDVVYSKKRPKVKIYELISYISAKTIIGDGYGTINDASLMASVLKPYYTKSTSWKYEQEVRCMTTINAQDQSRLIFDKDDVYYKMPLPTKIYIGCRAKGKEMDNLIKIAKTKGIKVIFLKTDDEYYSLTEK